MLDTSELSDMLHSDMLHLTCIIWYITQYFSSVAGVIWRFVAPAVGMMAVTQEESMQAQLHASASPKLHNVTGLYFSPDMGPFENCRSCLQGRLYISYL